MRYRNCKLWNTGTVHYLHCTAKHSKMSFYAWRVSFLASLQRLMAISNVAVNLLTLLVDGMFIYYANALQMSTLGHATVGGLLSNQPPSQYVIDCPWVHWLTQHRPPFHGSVIYSYVFFFFSDLLCHTGNVKTFTPVASQTLYSSLCIFKEISHKSVLSEDVIINSSYLLTPSCVVLVHVVNFVCCPHTYVSLRQPRSASSTFAS